jgi:hypothetical protein
MSPWQVTNPVLMPPLASEILHEFFAVFDLGQFIEQPTFFESFGSHHPIVGIIVCQNDRYRSSRHTPMPTFQGLHNRSDNRLCCFDHRSQTRNLRDNSPANPNGLFEVLFIGPSHYMS